MDLEASQTVQVVNQMDLEEASLMGLEAGSQVVNSKLSA
jgi:hypothetical protein